MTEPFFSESPKYIFWETKSIDVLWLIHSKVGGRLGCVEYKMASKPKQWVLGVLVCLSPCPTQMVVLKNLECWSLPSHTLSDFTWQFLPAVYSNVGYSALQGLTGSPTNTGKLPFYRGEETSWMPTALCHAGGGWMLLWCTGLMCTCQIVWWGQR